MSDTLTAKRREAVGSRASMKLRAEGLVPAVLYGHKEAPVTLTIGAKELRKALAHKAKVVQLEGDVEDQALVQELQWDTFHRHLLHIDLLRVSKGEKVQVSIPIEIKGEAAGAQEGGVVTVINDSVEIEAAPANLPDVLHINISLMNIGDSMTASQILDLPDGATLITAPERVLVNCVPPATAPTLDDVAEGGESPEVIGEAESGDKAEGEEGDKEE